MSIKSVMPSSHLILCHPLLLLPSIFSSLRDFSNESALPIRWPKYWSFIFILSSVQFSHSVMSDSLQSSLSITSSQSSLKLMSIKSVMPSKHLILCRLLLLLPSIFPSIRVFSRESALHIRWPKYWSFSFNISLAMNTQH